MLRLVYGISPYYARKKGAAVAGQSNKKDGSPSFKNQASRQAVLSYSPPSRINPRRKPALSLKLATAQVAGSDGFGDIEGLIRIANHIRFSNVCLVC